MKTLLPFFLSMLVFLPSAFSDSPAPKGIPDSLKDWIPWAKDDLPALECARENRDSLPESNNSTPTLLNNCIWFGNAVYKITDKGADINVQVHNLFKDSKLIQLPWGYGLHLSDIEVSSNGAPFHAFSLNQTENDLSISLPEGTFEIRGKIFWDKFPSQIPLPSTYGLVNINLSLIQDSILARRDIDHIELVSKEETQVADSIRAEVYRKLNDGSPLEIATRIQLSVSGKTRIEDFGSFLPLDSQLISIEGPLQSFIDANGNIKIKVSQGTFTASFVSTLRQPRTSIEFSHKPSAIWPKEETWIWEGSQELRSVELKGVNSINGAQAHLPSDWQSDSALIVSSLEDVTLEIKRRGEEKPGANSLSLQRSIWPNLNSSGYSISDTIQSSFKGTFRLNATKDLEVGRVSINNNPIPITIDPKNELKGIEIRKENQTISAISQTNAQSKFSATGWDHDFENVNINVNIPPSWKLFYANGVSNAYGTWISTWSIFDVFILAILIIFTQQIMGTKLAVLFTVFSVIGRTEFMLPTVYFSYIVILVALLKLTSEKSSKYVLLPLYFCIAISFVAFFIQGLSFAKLQTIQLLHPQLQSGTRYRTMIQEILAIVDAMPLSWILILAGLAFTVLVLRWCFMAPKVSGKLFRLFLGFIAIAMGSSILAGIGGIFFGNRIVERSVHPQPGYYSTNALPPEAQMEESYYDLNYKSDAPYERSGSAGKTLSKIAKKQISLKSRTIQAGPSLPSWTWRQAQLSIAGPISSDHQIELVFIKPWLQRIFSVLRLILIFVLIALLSKYLVGILEERGTQLRSVLSKSGSNLSTILVLFILQTNIARADFPDNQILAGLTQRIEDTLCTEDTCSSIDLMEIFLSENEFRIEIRAYSKGRSLIKIPGTIEDLLINEVNINNSNTTYLNVDNQFLQVKLDSGQNRVTVKGFLPEKNALSIKIPQRPLRIEIKASDWDIGAYDKGGSNEVIQVSRLSNGSAENTERIDVPKYITENWFLVERNIKVGDQIESSGTITRLGDLSREITFLIPLKAEEQLTVADLLTKDRSIVATFKPGESIVSFATSFKTGETISLLAESNKSLSETWNISCEDYVSCSFEGDITPNKRLDGEGHNVYKFIPFPGEKIAIKKLTLNSATGESLNIQNIQHQISWGESVLTGQLSLSLLTTKQTNLDILFDDPEVSIETVSVDGTTDARPFMNGQVKLLLDPEVKSIQVNYKKTSFSPSFQETAPQIKLSSKAGNISTNIQTNQARWLIWLDGSTWGPAILIWSKIFACVLILLALRKFSLITLKISSLLVLSFALSLMPTIILPIPLLWISLVRESKLKELCHNKCPKYVYLSALSILAVLSVAIIYLIIRIGLLGDPPLLVAGNSSTLTSLNWYTDFCGESGSPCTLPAPWIMSLPIAYWRAVTLFISLFLFILTVRLVKETAQIVRGGE